MLQTTTSHERTRLHSEKTTLQKVANQILIDNGLGLTQKSYRECISHLKREIGFRFTQNEVFQELLKQKKIKETRPLVPELSVREWLQKIITRKYSRKITRIFPYRYSGSISVEFTLIERPKVLLIESVIGWNKYRGQYYPIRQYNVLIYLPPLFEIRLVNSEIVVNRKGSLWGHKMVQGRGYKVYFELIYDNKPLSLEMAEEYVEFLSANQLKKICSRNKRFKEKFALLVA